MKNSLVVVLIFMLSGCLAMVGQSCNYDKTSLYGRVVETNSSVMIVELDNPITQELSRIQVRPDRRAEIGDKLPVEMAEIISGTCTPLSYRVFSKSYYDIVSSSIIFNDEGQILEGQEETLLLITQNFSTLHSHFKKTVLVMQGQRNQKNSDEYSYALSIRYATQVKKLLEKEGLAVSSLKVVGFGRDAISVDKKSSSTNKVSFSLEMIK